MNEIVLEYDGSECIELVKMLTTCTCNCAPTPFQILYPPQRYVLKHNYNVQLTSQILGLFITTVT